MSEGLDFLSKTVLEYRHIEWTFAVKHNLDFYDYFVIGTFNLKGISFFLDAGKPIPSVLKTVVLMLYD